MIWCDMIWYDMIWYDMILFAQIHGPKAELQSTIWKEKTQYDQKIKAISTAVDNRETKPNWGSMQAKEKIESKKSNYGSLL